jgi:Na+-translocating ferredoxin:NAD+ oxidoreductase subunit C
VSRSRRPIGFVSVPMHAPATGVIRAIGLAPTAEGPKTPAIFLKVYHAASQQVLYGLDCEPERMNAKDVIQAVQQAGLVGLGGGAFPSHVKMKPPGRRVIQTLVVNGCECEPYLTCDHRIMLEQTDDADAGYPDRAAGDPRRARHHRHRGQQADAMSASARANLPAHLPITVEAVKTKYPQGAEKMLIKPAGPGGSGRRSAGRCGRGGL